jgi:hypothetical protein
MTSKRLKSNADKEFQLLNVTEKAPAASLQQVLDSIQKTNDSIRTAIESGISIELVRTSRLHNGQGSWGDQIAPAIRKGEA